MVLKKISNTFDVVHKHPLMFNHGTTFHKIAGINSTHHLIQRDFLSLSLHSLLLVYSPIVPHLPTSPLKILSLSLVMHVHTHAQ